jgi:hypothetical protein
VPVLLPVVTAIFVILMMMVILLVVAQGFGMVVNLVVAKIVFVEVVERLVAHLVVAVFSYPSKFVAFEQVLDVCSLMIFFLPQLLLQKSVEVLCSIVVVVVVAVVEAQVVVHWVLEHWVVCSKIE